MFRAFKVKGWVHILCLVALGRLAVAAMPDHPIITEVLPDTGAEEAGLLGVSDQSDGDVIIAIRGKSMTQPVEVHRQEDLQLILDQHQLGDTIELTIVRRPLGKRHQEHLVKVTLKTTTQRQR